eukprot:jgi/Mesvir1/15806/Mv03364-RA.2
MIACTILARAYFPHRYLETQEVVREAAIILLVPPSHHFRRIATAAAPAVRPDAMVVVATKGLEESSLSLLSDVLKEVMPSVSSDRLAFLAGPSFAKDVARGLPTDVSVASEGMVAAHLVQNAFHAPHFRVYASDDMVGLQIGGAVKNVMAVACGACDGMDMGTNARAALITRGLAEMTRLGVALGANPLTFLGLTGVGDLVLTSTGDLSRNRTLGLAVGKGEDPKEFLASKKTVAEGYFTAAAAYKLAKKIGVDMPITEGVYQVLHEGRPIKAVAKELMFREPKDELQGIQK